MALHQQESQRPAWFEIDSDRSPFPWWSCASAAQHQETEANLVQLLVQKCVCGRCHIKWTKIWHLNSFWNSFWHTCYSDDWAETAIRPSELHAFGKRLLKAEFLPHVVLKVLVACSAKLIHRGWLLNMLLTSWHYRFEENALIPKNNLVAQWNLGTNLGTAPDSFCNVLL